MPRKPSSSRITLAAAFRAALDAAGWSDSEAARRAGLARSQITRFRRGDRALGLDAADALAEALGLHLVAIAGRRAKTPATQTSTPGPPAHTAPAPECTDDGSPAPRASAGDLI